jgi:hypothetical protein
MVKKFRIWKLLNLRSKLEQRVASDERRATRNLGFGIWDLGFGIWDLEIKNIQPATCIHTPIKSKKPPKVAPSGVLH